MDVPIDFEFEDYEYEDKPAILIKANERILGNVPADLVQEFIELVNKAGIRNVHIISYTPEYFSQKPKFEIMQYITISEIGEVTFDAYKAGEKFNELKSVRKEKKEIDKIIKL